MRGGDSGKGSVVTVLAIEFRLPKGTKREQGTCMGCGCTDAMACPEGCAWVDPAHLLCTACLARALDAVDPRGRVEVSNVSDQHGDYVALIVPLKRPKPAKRRRR